MQRSNVKRMTGISMLGALAFVLMFFAFPVIPAVPFMKVDFSDVPIIIGMFLYGPVGGTIAALIRTLLHYIQTGGDAGYPIGDAASFLATLAYCLPVYALLRSNAGKPKNMVLATSAGALSLTVIMTIANYFALIPLYMTVMNFSVGPVREYILLGVVPFNLIKGVLISIVFAVLYAKLKPWILRNQSAYADSQVQHLNKN